MHGEILTVGDELLIGQIINTNQAYIAERLNQAGIDVTCMTTVGDDPSAIQAAFRQAWDRSEVVIVTGGLGPTHDDITKNAICAFFADHLVSDAAVRQRIEALMASRNLPWSDAAESQTKVPSKARALPNPMGTAPGLLVEERGKIFIALPGVPYEMRAIIDESVLPFLRDRVRGSVILHRTLRTTGIAESSLSQRLGNIGDIIESASLAFLPSPFGVRLRVTVRGNDETTAAAMIHRIEERIRSKAGQYIYGVDEEELEEVLGSILASRGLTIGVAESCTGGLIADRLTNVSGSSAYFERGVIAYSNKAKSEVLGVPEEMIRKHGAVSKEVAEAMAAGVRERARTHIGLSTTGIAGPTGGTTEKPVGLVWIGYADAHGGLALKFNFGSSRVLIKQRASQAALELVRRRVLELGG